MSNLNKIGTDGFHFEIVKGEEIKCGAVLNIERDDRGEMIVRLAGAEYPPNAQAAEDLIGPDVRWEYETGKVFNTKQ